MQKASKDKENSVNKITYTDLNISPKLDLSQGQRYKYQSVCKVCSKTLKSSYFSSSKKYHCKFCYCAVCFNCSTLKCYHPIINKAKRVCIGCYNEAVKNRIKENSKELVPKLIKQAVEESRINLEEIGSYEDEADVLKRQIISRREDLIKLTKELESFSKVKQESIYEKVQFLEEGKEKHKNLLKKLEKVEEELRSKDLELSEVKEKAKKNERILSGLLEEIRFAKEGQNNGSDGYRNKCLEVLKNQISLNTGMLNTIKRDMINMKDDIRHMKSEDSCVMF